MIKRDQHDTPEPTAEERRRAVCDAMAISPGLIRFASRFTRSLHDAEDAYQRAMEIALTRAPVTDQKRFLAWLRTVLKHEALAIAVERARESTGLEEDVAEGPIPAVAPGPEAAAEWRARYLAIQDALGQLTESQRICLILQGAGSSYEQIADLTGYSPRKIERSVIEGRSRLRAWEVRIETGGVCRDLDGALERSALGETSGRREQRAVERHVKHCRSCRTLLASRSHRARGLAALVPIALVAQPLATATPDPGPYLAVWDRAFGGLTVRAGQLIQFGLELPGSTIGRVAAGAGALVLAVFTAVPIVSDYVDRDSASRPEPAAVVQSRPETTSAAAGRVPTTGQRTPVAQTNPARQQRGLSASTAADPNGPPAQPASASAHRQTTPHASTRPAAKPDSTTPSPQRARRVESSASTPSAPATSPAPRRVAAAPAAPARITSADVAIPYEEPQAGPDGAVIYGD